MGGIGTCGKAMVRLATLALAALTLVPDRASADLTVEALMAPAVTGVGPFYQDLDDAIKAFAAGDYTTAYARLESARKSTPRLAPPEIMMARLYFDANLPNPGIAMLEKAARTIPDDPEALVMLAEVALAGGRLIEATLLYEKAAGPVDAYRANPTRQEDLRRRLLNGASLVAEANGNWAAAQKLLEELLGIDADNAAARDRLGRVLFRQGKGEEAYKQFQQAAQGDSNLPPAELAMAQLFSDKENAEKWIKFALDRSGDDVRTQLAVGQFRLRAQRLDEAKDHAKKALQIDPEGLNPNLLAGMLARMDNDFPAAVKHLGAAHLLAPADPAIINNLALTLIEMPDDASRKLALQYAEINLRQNPAGIDQLATAGWIHYRLGRRADAERALSAALKASAAQNDNKISADMGYYLSVLAVDSGQATKATSLLRNALNTTAPFAYREQAQALLAKAQEMAAKNPESGATTATGAGTAKAGGP